MSTEIIKAEKFGIEEKTATELTNGLAVPRAERKLLKEEFDKVSKLEITKENKSVFKDLRLRIRNNRTKGTNVWHKAGKEYFLRGGQFLDAIKNKDNQENEAMEQVLLDAENHFENLEKERITKLQKERVKILSEYIEDAHERDLAQMEDDVWESFLQVKRQTYLDKIESEKKAEEERIKVEKLEAEKLELSQKRQSELRPYYAFLKEDLDLKELPEKEYQSKLKELKKLKSEHDAEQQRILDENNRLKKEAEEKAELIASRTKELQPFVVFIRDYNGLISKDEKEYQKEFSDIKKGAQDHWEFERKEKERKEKEEKQNQIEADKLAKIQAKKEADAEAERKRLQDELDAKNKAEQIAEDLRVKKQIEEENKRQELAKAPIKKQLNIWVETFELPHLRTDNEKAFLIKNKFESFKKWAKTEIDKL